MPARNPWSTYNQYYFNKKEKTCKARGIKEKNIFKKVSNWFPMRVLEDFSKNYNYLFDPTNFLVAS